MARYFTSWLGTGVAAGEGVTAGVGVAVSFWITAGLGTGNTSVGSFAPLKTA